MSSIFLKDIVERGGVVLRLKTSPAGKLERAVGRDVVCVVLILRCTDYRDEYTQGKVGMGARASGERVSEGRAGLWAGGERRRVIYRCVGLATALARPTELSRAVKLQR